MTWDFKQSIATQYSTVSAFSKEGQWIQKFSLIKGRIKHFIFLFPLFINFLNGKSVFSMWHQPAKWPMTAYYSSYTTSKHFEKAELISLYICHVIHLLVIPLNFKSHKLFKPGFNCTSKGKRENINCKLSVAKQSGPL